MAVAPVPDLCWDLDPACLTEAWDQFSEDVKERSAFLAVASLRSLTAYRVGGCPITLRPCKPSCALPGWYRLDSYAQNGGSFFPNNYAGIWSNGCGCSGDCGCKATCEVKLPAPIGDVIQVKVDGSVVPLTDFRIDNADTLVYMGTGDCPFNMEQDLNKPDTEAGTWSVTYVNAYPVDALASYAAGLLAFEFAKACAGTGCRLPANVREVAKQGITYTINPGAFPDGFTGIREIDVFIRLWRPEGSPTRAPLIYSPDVAQVRHTTRSY